MVTDIINILYICNRAYNRKTETGVLLYALCVCTVIHVFQICYCVSGCVLHVQVLGFRVNTFHAYMYSSSGLPYLSKKMNAETDF